MTISRADLLKELMPGLNALFGEAYANYQNKPKYKMKSSYGKYSIYKYEHVFHNEWKSTTLAKGLSKEAATGMMKLLEEEDE